MSLGKVGFQNYPNIKEIASRAGKIGGKVSALKLVKWLKKNGPWNAGKAGQYQLAKRIETKKICKKCLTEFIVIETEHDKSDRNFCSVTCRKSFGMIKVRAKQTAGMFVFINCYICNKTIRHKIGTINNDRTCSKK